MRRREQVTRISELFKELWGDLAVEAAVSTYSTLCSDEQLAVLLEKLEKDIQLRGIISSTQETNEGVSTK